MISEQRVKELREKVARKKREKALKNEERRLEEELEKDTVKGKFKQGAKAIFDWMG